MNFRNLTPRDINPIKEIHEKYYKDEFSLEDFFHNINYPIIIEEDNQIILAAGMRPIIESVAITNKDLSVRQRREALLLALRWMIVKTKESNEHGLHCFVQDEPWINILKKYGFRPTKGQSLVLTF